MEQIAKRYVIEDGTGSERDLAQRRRFERVDVVDVGLVVVEHVEVHGWRCVT
jgi:hypothetical protein